MAGDAASKQGGSAAAVQPSAMWRCTSSIVQQPAEGSKCAILASHQQRTCVQQQAALVTGHVRKDGGPGTGQWRLVACKRLGLGGSRDGWLVGKLSRDILETFRAFTQHGLPKKVRVAPGGAGGRAAARRPSVATQALSAAHRPSPRLTQVHVESLPLGSGVPVRRAQRVALLPPPPVVAAEVVEALRVPA